MKSTSNEACTWHRGVHCRLRSIEIAAANDAPNSDWLIGLNSRPIGIAAFNVQCLPGRRLVLENEELQAHSPIEIAAFNVV